MSILESIHYEGENNVLVYRVPETNFATYSRLTVKESQEAILFAEGQMCDTFRGGAYTLHTKNIPILRALVNLPFGGDSPFQCEVYFINRAISLNHKWGTASQTQVYDKTYGLYLDIGASGTMGLRVVDPRKAMMEIVGSENVLTAEQCIEYFRTNMSMKVKDYLGNLMTEDGMDFMVLKRSLVKISKDLQVLLNEDFADVGMEVYKFALENVAIPAEQLDVVVQAAQNKKKLENDRVIAIERAKIDRDSMKIAAEGEAERTLIGAQAAGQARVIEGQAEGKYREAQGYNYADEVLGQGFVEYAKSGTPQSGLGGALGQFGIGLGMGQAFGGNVSQVMGTGFSQPPQAFGNQAAPQQQATPQDDFGLGDDISPAAQEPTQPTAGSGVTQSPKEKLSDLKQMLDMGLITQGDYDDTKAEILRKMREL